MSLKTITIGDLHGSSTWKSIDVSAFDKIIFIGDYVDHKLISSEVIIKNLHEIIQLKVQFTDKVILLLGNHDIQYLYYPLYRCGGFNSIAQPELTRLFIDHTSLFQIAFQIENYLWTHAGICNRWLSHNNLYLGKSQNWEIVLTELYAKQKFDILFQIGKARKGKYKAGGPLWCDKDELIHGIPQHLHQIVGHNKIKNIHTLNLINKSITYTDCLNYNQKFYELCIDGPKKSFSFWSIFDNIFRIFKN